MDKEPTYISAMNDPSGSAPSGYLFEQPEGAVKSIEPKGERHKHNAQYNAEQDAEQTVEPVDERHLLRGVAGLRLRLWGHAGSLAKTDRHTG